jgi:hypothetical protein
MQIPVLSGVFTDEDADFRTSYPRNMIPVPKSQGISEGYLRPCEGITQKGVGPGICRGGILWDGILFRVMGTNLVRIASNGTITILATIPGSDEVTLDYSFDRLAIAADGKLYYWDGGALSQVTDPDLGTVLSVVWVDGYFMTTDGESLIVTDLNDPMSINPLHYGSSEADPDPVVALLKLRNEVYALNRNTIEVFNNIGGNGFPFQRNEGAQIQRGCLGTHCCAVFAEAIAFLGSARDESPAVWIGLNSTTQKISTREIDTILQEYTEAQLVASVMEARTDKSHQWLYLHFPDKTLVYDASASAAAQQPVWFVLDTSVAGGSAYRARYFVWAFNGWQVGDPTSGAIGEINQASSIQYGQTIGWEFSTSIVYNASMGAIFHQLELVSLPGRVAFGAAPVVWTSYSIDGETWSQERTCDAGVQGNRTKRITWLRQGFMRNWRIQKFRGTSDAHISVARLEAQLEPLNG